MHFSIDRTVHTTAFDKPVMDHWLERKITQTAAGSTEKDRSDDRPLQRRARFFFFFFLIKYRTRQIKTTETYKLQLLRFVLSCPILEKDNFILKNVYCIVLSY